MPILNDFKKERYHIPVQNIKALNISFTCEMYQIFSSFIGQKTHISPTISDSNVSHTFYTWPKH